MHRSAAKLHREGREKQSNTGADATLLILMTKATGQAPASILGVKFSADHVTLSRSGGAVERTRWQANKQKHSH